MKQATTKITGDISPTSNEGTKTEFAATNKSTKSPSKYEKLKLLDSAPKEGPPANAKELSPRSVGSDDELSGSKLKATSVFKNTMEEKQKRNKMLKKMILLKEFEVEGQQAEDLKVITPALEANAELD